MSICISLYGISGGVSGLTERCDISQTIVELAVSVLTLLSKSVLRATVHIKY